MSHGKVVPESKSYLLPTCNWLVRSDKNPHLNVPLRATPETRTLANVAHRLLKSLRAAGVALPRKTLTRKNNFYMMRSGRRHNQGVRPRHQ